MCNLEVDIRLIDVGQAFAQSEINENVFLRLAKGCGAITGNTVNLCGSLHHLRHASRQRHHHVVRGMRRPGIRLFEVDACVMRLVGEGGILPQSASVESSGVRAPVGSQNNRPPVAQNRSLQQQRSRKTPTWLFHRSRPYS